MSDLKKQEKEIRIIYYLYKMQLSIKQAFDKSILPKIKTIIRKLKNNVDMQNEIEAIKKKIKGEDNGKKE